MSEDCQKCGTAMYDLGEERLCPGCSNHETENETMTTNQTIDVMLVSRELLRRVSDPYAPKGQELARAELRALLDAKPETVAGHHAACRAVDDYKPGECSHGCKPAVQPQPDPVLCKFYDVTDYPDLVRELVGHVALLQDSAKRNVKPWEDTFPPTLLPAYIERVNAENAAVQPQGEPVAWTYCPECGCEEIHHQQGRHKQCAECHQEWFSDLDYSDVVRRHLKKLKAEQPAPVAVNKLGTHHVLGAIHNVEGFPGVTGYQIKTLTDLLNSAITGK